MKMCWNIGEKCVYSFENVIKNVYKYKINVKMLLNVFPNFVLFITILNIDIFSS